MNNAAQIPQTSITAPANLQPAVVLSAQSLKADPVKIASERRTSTVIDGLAFGVLGGLMGLSFSRGSVNRGAVIATTSALGGVLGAGLAQLGKTREESYSEIFTDAARSNDFTGHVKREMSRRENMDFVMGALCGFWPIY